MTTNLPVDAPVGCLEVDAEGHIVRANAEAARLLGDAPGGLRGRPLTGFLSLAVRMIFQTHVMPTLDLKGRIDELYVSLRGASGQATPVLMNASRRRSPSGFVDVFVFLPTHRRSLFEGELVQARQAAERSASGERSALERVDAMQSQLAIAERMASIGTLAAGVAHEINNPLAYVSANLEMVAEALAAGPDDARRDVAQAVADVQQGVARIRDVVSSLRKLSRVDDGRRDPIDLGHVVDIALKLSGVELRQRARVEVDVASPAPRVLADEGRLCQIAVNLLVNAAQALPPESRAQNLVRIVARYDGDDRAVFEVSDNGPGVPPTLHQRIFDPFFTTKPIGEGTGLGLAVCHGIVTALGGTIALESEPGRGACFRVTLPCLPRRATATLLARAEAAAPNAPPAPAAAAFLAPPASTRAPLTAAPASTRAPLTAAPASTRAPLTAAPASTRAPLAEPPASIRAPLAEPPASIRAPLAEPPASIRAPSASPTAASRASWSVPPASSSPPSATMSPQAGSRRVLVVDDEVQLARVFSRALSDCEVICCSTGKAALERFEAEGFDAFDVIVCDLLMPEMTGMELFTAVRAASPATARRMIFMTGGTFTDAARDFLNSVENVTLLKPFTLPELRRAIAGVLAQPALPLPAG